DRHPGRAAGLGTGAGDLACAGPGLRAHPGRERADTGRAVHHPAGLERAGGGVAGRDRDRGRARPAAGPARGPIPTGEYEVTSLGALRGARQFTATAWRRSAVAALALLAGLVCFATTAAARADFATHTRALHATIDAAPPTTAMVTAVSDWGAFTQSLGAKVSEIENAGARIRGQLAATLPLAEPSSASWSELQVPQRAVLAPPSAHQAGGIGARMRLVYRDTYQTHSRLLSGHWPTDDQDPKAPLEADLSSATAARLGLHIGSLTTIQAPDETGTTTLRIVGLDANQFWATDALIGPAQATALITPSTAAADAGNASAPGDFRVSWNFPLDLSGLNA